MVKDGEPPKPNRRDLVLVSAATFAGMGGLLALWPFVAQMNPGAGTPPPPRMDVDLQDIALGRTITVRWQERPVFIRHRTNDEIEKARAVEAKDFHDQLARNDALPQQATARDDNRIVSGYPQWLVVLALCTHDGCVLATLERVALGPGESFACPCCNARFDFSGRVKSGPAPANLTVPRYEFVSPTRIRLL